MNEQLEETIKLVPSLPGCYIYYNKANEIIYVGKAKNLKRRVYSYFHKQHDSVKVTVLVSQIEKMEYIITDSEVEALILESHLIKKHKPTFLEKIYHYLFLNFNYGISDCYSFTLPFSLFLRMERHRKQSLRFDTR